MTTPTIEDRLSKVESDLAKKTDKPAGIKNEAPSVNWTDWKVNWSKWVEIIVVTKITAIFTLGLPKLFNIDTAIEKRFNLERNKWGFLWKKPENLLDAQILRLDALEPEVRRNTTNIRLLQGADRNIHLRIDGIERRRTESRNQVSTGDRAQRRPAPVGGNEAARIRDLELRVTNLVRALG
ncbi:hypothetical protein AB8O64_16210 [Streptomyces sp. QH1-20]|uniref:hypothetical protein n=1 Tax=Streptomyces sp. QH1-20 TaxID=3240934 RepID=UPI003517AC19